MHPRRPQPSAHFSAPICRPQPSAQPSSLITSGFFSPPISSRPLAPTPSAAVRAVLRIHLPSAAVRAAKVAHLQRLLLPTHFQPLPCTQAVRSRPLHSFPFLSHPFPFFPILSLPFPFFPILSLPFPSFPFLSLHFPSFPFPFPFFPILSLPVSLPCPSFPFLSLLPTYFPPLRCTHAFRSHPRSSSHPFAVRSRPRSQGRSSPAASSPHPFPATPLHPRRPQPSAQFSASICRPQPSAQPRSLICSGFFSPPISSHSIAPTPSAAVHAVLRTHLPSAAVRAAKLAHHQRLLLPTHFQPPTCTHAVRSRPRTSPHPFAVRSRPRSQGRSSPAASSPHPFPATPLHPRRPQPSTPRGSPHPFAVRAAKVAHHQRLLLPTHFQPLRCTHAVRSRPHSSPHPFAVRSRPRSQGRSSPAASSFHPFPAAPLHPRRPQPFAQFSAPIGRQPSAQPRSLITSVFFSPPISSHSVAPTPSAAVHATRFSAPISRPQPSAQPRSLFTSGFFSPPIPSHPLAPTPFAAVHAVLRTHLPSAAVRAAKAAPHRRLLLFTHFQPPPCTQAVRIRPRSSPHPLAVSRPRSQVANHQQLLFSIRFQPLRCTTPSAAVRAVLRTNFPRPPPSAQPRSLITSGFFSPPISSHAVALAPSTTVRAVLRTHVPSAQPRSPITSGFFSPPISSHSVAPTPSTVFSAPIWRPRPSAQPSRSSPAASSPHPFPATPLHPRRPQPSTPRGSPHPFAVRAAKVAHHQRLLLPTHFQPLRCTHAVRSRPRHAVLRTHLPSAQPRSLITSGFFSPPISSHSVAPTPSAAVHTVLRTHLPSAAVRAAKVAPDQQLLLFTHFQPPPCTHAVRSRSRSSPHPLAVSRPRSQGRSSPASSSPHAFPATPLHPRRPQPSKPRGFPHPLAVRSRPRSQGRSSPAASSPHPFLATPLHPRRSQPSTQFSAPICRPQPSAQPRPLLTSGFFSSLISSRPLAPRPSASVRAVLRTHWPSAVRAAKSLITSNFYSPSVSSHSVAPRRPQPSAQFSAPIFPVRRRPRSHARSSPAAFSPHPFPATPLHSRHPQPSAQFSAPMCRPRSQGRPSPAAFSPHPYPATPLHPRRPRCSPHPFGVRGRPRSQVAHHQRLLLPTHFQPRRCTRAIHNRPRSSPHPCAVRAAKVAHHQRLFLPTHIQPLRCTHAVHGVLRTHLASAAVRAAKSLITSGFFSPPISSHPLAPTPSAAVRAVLRTHWPSAICAAKVAHHQQLLHPTHS